MGTLIGVFHLYNDIQANQTESNLGPSNTTMDGSSKFIPSSPLQNNQEETSMKNKSSFNKSNNLTKLLADESKGEIIYFYFLEERIENSHLSGHEIWDISGVDIDQ